MGLLVDALIAELDHLVATDGMLCSCHRLGKKTIFWELKDLLKALEGGGYNARPTKLHQCRRDNQCGVRGCDPSLPFEEGVDYCYDCGSPTPCNVDHTPYGPDSFGGEDYPSGER